MHAQRVSDFADTGSDLSETEKPQGLSIELGQRAVPETEIAVAAPDALMHEITVVSDFICDLQKEGNGHLRGGKGCIFRDIRYGDPVFSAVFHIHDVKARGQAADVLQVGELFQHLFRKTCFISETYGNTIQSFEDLGWRGVIIDHQFAEFFKGSPGDVARVFRVSVKYYDLHFNSPQLGIIV